jgi:hypothetical protein
MSTHRRSAALLLPGLLLLMTAAPASAHTELVSGTPGPGVTVNGAVGDLTLTFVSPVVAEGTQVVVRDPRGANHAGTAATLGPQARVVLQPLTRPGTYTVSYRAVAGDGHPIIGGYEFRVSDKGAAAARSQGRSAAIGGTAGAGTGAEATTLATAAAGSGSSGSGLLIGGAGTAALTVLLLAGARRRTQAEEVC